MNIERRKNIYEANFSLRVQHIMFKLGTKIKPGDPIYISKISSQGQILKDMNWTVFASAGV